ncbi:hypothetical protein V6N11_018390 [Hibiscus sabdariffa]|uniref:Uncharacterized protein n=1 Tax=Hibiscus sabdariffa TaxID=183260 RepID=A0ABR2T788_9ROSI
MSNDGTLPLKCLVIGYPKLVLGFNARIDQPRQMEAAAESNREAVLKQLWTKRPRTQAEEKRPAEIFCLGGKKEYIKGFRFNQNILLNIPV